MSRPRRVSDEEVFAAVRQAVVAQGPQVSLDVVAESLDISAPALFRRFGSRNALLLRALRPTERPPFLDFLDAGPGEGPIAAQLADLCSHVLGSLQATLPCISALRESGLTQDEIFPPPGDPPPLAALRGLSGWLRRARDRGLLDLRDPEDAALALLGALQAPVFMRHISKSTAPWDACAYGQRLTQMLLQGLAPKETTATFTSPTTELPSTPSPGHAKERSQ